MSNAQPATGSQPDEIGDNIRSEIGSILLASTDPDALRTWYERAFGVTTPESPDIIVRRKHRLSELQRDDPMILHLSRGHF